MELFFIPFLFANCYSIIIIIIITIIIIIIIC